MNRLVKTNPADSFVD